MVIADLNYMQAIESNLQGGTFAAAGSSASGIGVLVSARTGAGARSISSFFGFYRYSTASTYGSASAVSGVVNSSSYAYSFT